MASAIRSIITTAWWDMEPNVRLSSRRTWPKCPAVETATPESPSSLARTASASCPAPKPATIQSGFHAATLLARDRAYGTYTPLRGQIDGAKVCHDVIEQRATTVGLRIPGIRKHLYAGSAWTAERPGGRDPLAKAGHFPAGIMVLPGQVASDLQGIRDRFQIGKDRHHSEGLYANRAQ